MSLAYIFPKNPEHLGTCIAGILVGFIAWGLMRNAGRVKLRTWMPTMAALYAGFYAAGNYATTLYFGPAKQTVEILGSSGITLGIVAGSVGLGLLFGAAAYGTMKLVAKLGSTTTLDVQARPAWRSGRMDVRTAQVGFCFGIERAYGAFDKHARTGERIHVAHRAGGAWDTLRRIERGDAKLLDRYPALRNVAVTHDVATLQNGDKLVLGFHGLAEDTKTALANRGVALVEDMLCPFIAKLDRVVEQAAGDGFDIAIVGKKGNHHCNVAEEMAQQHGQRCYVIESPQDLDTIPKDGRRVALVGQVTGNTVTFDAVIDRVERENMPMRIFRTMCGDSRTGRKARSNSPRRRTWSS